MHKLVSAAVMAAVLLAPAPAVGSSVDVPSGGHRVMVIGDSVTHGGDGDWTWRYFAWRALTAEQHDLVDFVGPDRSTYAGGSGSGSYADADFDQDHASRWGLSLWEVLDRAWWPDSPRVDDLVAAHDPDVVVMALGVNDLLFYGFDADTLSDQVVRFVDEARSADPDVDVVLGGVPQVWIDHAAAFNAGLPALASRLSTDQSTVVAAPVPEWEQGVDTWDTAHPTRLGEEKLAASFVEALRPLVQAPAADTTPVQTPVPPVEPPAEPTVEDPAVEEPAVEEPAVEDPATDPVASEPTDNPAVEQPGHVGAITVPTAVPTAPAATSADRPDRPRGVRAARNGQRVRVTWRAADGATSYVVRCGATTRTVAGTRVTLRTTASRCRVRATGVGGASSWATVKVARGPRT